MQDSKKINLDLITQDWIEKNIPVKKGKLYLFFKRATDIFFGVIGLVIFVILFLPVGLFIKIDSKGSVIFKQGRVGKNGKIFTIYKFRTMHDSNVGKEEKWREKNNSSVTRFGKFLRKTHIDEIPQAINLLMGDLSFVGPRAEWVDLARIFEKEIPFYSARYLVKPGMVGWAQINYPASKSVLQAREKFEYDLYYIKNRSIILDSEIILKSPKLFFQ